MSLPSQRRKARQLLVQALYQWQMAGSAINVIEAEFRTDYDMKPVDIQYFHELLHEVPARLDALETVFGKYLQDRQLKELDPITLALLRMATYELKNRIDVPYKVVINESVSLAKKFGASDAHKFINGVLDKVAAQHRALAVQADRR